MITEGLGVCEDFKCTSLQTTEVSDVSIPNPIINQDNKLPLSADPNEVESDSIKSVNSIVVTSQQQLHTSEKRKKYDVLGHSDFMNIASKLSNVCQRNEKYGTAVGAMMLQMLEICEGKNGIDFKSLSDTSINEHFQSIICNYNISFKSVTDISVSHNRSIVPPYKIAHYQNESSKQLIPSVEKFKNDNYQFKKERGELIAIPSITSTCKK